jgi:prepilin-type processing-associated H-X9-DG protein
MMGVIVDQKQGPDFRHFGTNTNVLFVDGSKLFDYV